MKSIMAQVLAAVGLTAVSYGLTGVALTLRSDDTCVTGTQVASGTYAVSGCTATCTDAVNNRCETRSYTPGGGPSSYSWCSCHNLTFNPSSPGSTPLCFAYRIGSEHGAGRGCSVATECLSPNKCGFHGANTCTCSQ
jgi:hypothetical protein